MVNVSTPRRRYRRWTLDTTQPTIMLFGTSQQLPMAACKANMPFHCCMESAINHASMGMPHSAPGHSGHRDTGTPGQAVRKPPCKKTYISRGREGGEKCVKTVHESCACFPLQYPGTLHELGYQGTRVPGLSTATCAAGKYASVQICLG